MASNNIKLLDRIIIQKDRSNYKHEIKNSLENIFISLPHPKVSGYDAFCKVNFMYQEYIKKYNN